MSEYSPTENDSDVQTLFAGATKEAWAAYQRISKRNYLLHRRHSRALRKIRESGGSPVLVLTEQGHSYCIHEADLALSPAPPP